MIGNRPIPKLGWSVLHNLLCMFTPKKHRWIYIFFLFPGPFQPSYGMMKKFYGLYKQATLGPCNEPKPAFWEAVKRTKWWVVFCDFHDMSKQQGSQRLLKGQKSILPTYNSVYIFPGTPSNTVIMSHPPTSIIFYWPVELLGTYCVHALQIHLFFQLWKYSFKSSEISNFLHRNSVLSTLCGHVHTSAHTWMVLYLCTLLWSIMGRSWITLWGRLGAMVTWYSLSHYHIINCFLWLSVYNVMSNSRGYFQ